MKQTRRTFLATSLAALAATPALAGVTKAGGPAFGSYWRVLLPPGASLPAGLVEGIIAEVDARMSPYRTDTDIGRFNAADTTDALPVAGETAQVARAALAISAETSGAYDPTVGPHVALFGYGPIHGAAAGAAGELSAEGRTLRKARGTLSIDLCGIAKGHALDRIATALNGLDLPGFLVELGGEIYARGRHPGGRPWQIAVEGVDARPMGVVSLADMAVATSANTVQAHIIDPRTGRTARGGLASVSVFDQSGMRADALATALVAMGREEALNFAERKGVAALLVGDDGAVRGTGGAEAWFMGEVRG